MKKRRSNGRKKPVKKTRRRSDPKMGMYLGLEYESFCELSLLYFAEELKKEGYISRVERSPSYMLCDPVQSTHAVHLKRGSKQETQTVMQGVSYTPDFDIYFTSKAIGVFCWVLGSGGKWDKNLLVAQYIHRNHVNGGTEIRACCEVKPDFSRNSTTPKSMLTMKWLYQKQGVFVNLFRPNRVFEGLFVPDKYRLTERGTPRLLKFKPLTLKQYLNDKRKSTTESIH